MPLGDSPVVRVVVALGAFTLLAGRVSGCREPRPTSTTAVAPAPPATRTARLLPAGAVAPLTFTYYFYWYDVATGRHLSPKDPLPTRPAPRPPTSYRSVAWHERQLRDIHAARIDSVLPVYWGDDPDEPWSTEGLDVLVAARRRLVAAGAPAPTIGMFYDTSILRGVNLTKPAGMATFYRHISTFFARIPPEHRTLVDGRPVVWLFLPTGKYDQRVFDHTVERFWQEFGVAPFIVRATGWKNVTTDASYVWGAAQTGMLATDLVAAVGPGYDERDIPGRRGTYRPRDDGRWYTTNLRAALRSKRPLLAIETWNEFHEASGIGENLEYGRRYISLTAELIDAYRREQAGSTHGPPRPAVSSSSRPPPRGR